MRNASAGRCLVSLKAKGANGELPGGNDLDGDAAQIPKGLLELRRTMDAINPHVLASKPRGFFSKLFEKNAALSKSRDRSR